MTADSDLPVFEEGSVALTSKSLRAAFRKCSAQLDDLTDEECARVIRALAALFGVECP